MAPCLALTIVQLEKTEARSKDDLEKRKKSRESLLDSVIPCETDSSSLHPYLDAKARPDQLTIPHDPLAV